jgi:hypothetical protein
MSDGANPMIFWPLWLSCMNKCILILVHRFLGMAIPNRKYV